MKKVLAILLGIVLLAASAYAASAYFIGKQVETSIGEPYKKFESDPNVKLVKRDYQRGVFVSTETVVLELFGDMFRALGQQPPTLTAHSTIHHGPAPRLSMMAAATVDSEVSFGVAGKPNQKFMTAHTVIRHDGSGDMTATGVPAAIDFTDPTGAARRVTWEAFQGAMQFSDGMKQYAMQGQMPRFEVSGEDGMRFMISGIKLDSTARQVFDNEPSLHAVTQKVTIGEVNAKARFGTGAVLMRKISYDVTTPVKGELLDGVMKSTIGEFVVEQKNYGPARLDVSLKNLHGRTIVKIQKVMADMNKKGQGQADPMAAVQPMLDAAVELFAHNPELVIDRLTFTTPQGEVLIKANVRLPGVTAEDASNFMVLGEKVEAALDAAVPEQLLMAQFGPTPVSVEAGNAQMQTRQKQIASLLEQGYVTREGTTMKTKLEYKGGQVTVNGLPFDPRLLVQQPQPVEQPMPMPTARPRGPAPMPTAR